ILFVLNYNDTLTEDDKKLFEAVSGLEYIVIVNKTDLKRHLDLDEVKKLAGKHPIVETSLVEDEAMDAIENAITDIFFSGDIGNQDITYVSNARHIQLLREAKKALEEAEIGRRTSTGRGRREAREDE